VIVHLESNSDADAVRRELTARGLWVQRMDAGGRTSFVVEACSAAVEPADLAAIRGVESVATGSSRTPRVDAQPPIVEVGDLGVGPGAAPVVMAGPCSIDTEERIHAIALRLGREGVRVLRGGAYKPRTSPYSFQGHGEVALQWMRDAANAAGMKVVTEAMGAEDVPLVAEYADIVQIGSRNMHNYSLLRTVGSAGRPVLLKRGMAATVEEWLAAGEYLLLHGARSVIFCERGIRGFDPTTRNVLDIGAVALLAQVHRLPVIVDPSHATGRRDLVVPLARAALAAGAAGVMLETHDAPGEALSDGPQALLPDQLTPLLQEICA